MKNTEIAFCSFKQYLSLGIYMDINRYTLEVMKIQLKYFVFFPSTWRIKLLIPQKLKFFWQLQTTFHMLRAYVLYLDIGRDDDDDYDDGEPSNEDKITISNLMMKSMQASN